MLSEMSNRKRQIFYAITYMWNLKKKSKINKLILFEQTQTHRYIEQISGYQWGEDMREGQDMGRRLTDTNYYL